MLFGNRDSFGMEIRPLVPTWERRYLPEKTAWAALLIWIRGENLCRHFVAGSERVDETLNVPLGPLANWLVESWDSLLFEERAGLFPTSDSLHEDLANWGDAAEPAEISEDVWVDAREAWWSRHFVVAGADGAILPPLALARQDEKLLIDWQTPRHPGGTGFFLAPRGHESVPWPDGEAVLAAFVQEVANWLRSEGLSDVYPWVLRNDPLREHRGNAVDALELFTGRNRDELVKLTGARNVEDVPGMLGLSATDDPGCSPIAQVLRDLPPGLPEEARAVLQSLDAATKGPAGADPKRRFRDLAFDAQRSAQSPEEAGYHAAAAVRADLGLDGKPVDSVEGMLAFLNVETTDSVVSLAGASRMLAGLREDGRPAVTLLSNPRTAVEWGRRFEHARALGHLLLDPIRGGALGAASSAFSQGSRHRRSGAFAAEFLLPKTALLDATDGILDRAADPPVFESLLERFGVGARTAAYHLWNRRLLSSTDVRDELIDGYARA